MFFIIKNIAAKVEGVCIRRGSPKFRHGIQYGSWKKKKGKSYPVQPNMCLILNHLPKSYMLGFLTLFCSWIVELEAQTTGKEDKWGERRAHITGRGGGELRSILYVYDITFSSIPFNCNIFSTNLYFQEHMHNKNII